MNQFTPGPWRVVLSDEGIWVQPPEANQNVICDIVLRAGTFSTFSAVEDEANATLIAAAPDLLAAATALSAFFESVSPHLVRLQLAQLLIPLRAAISKAEGRG